MLELRVKNYDRKVLETHSDVSFGLIDIEDSDIKRKMLEARRTKDSSFIAALILSKPDLREAIKFTDDGFETKGTRADADGLHTRDGVQDPWRIWEAVYIEH